MGREGWRRPRFTNRSRVLGLLGIIWLLTAYGVAVAPQTRLGLPHEILPVFIRVGLWLVPGLAAVITAAVWPKLDGTAWGLLNLPIAIYTGSFLYGWVIWLLPGSEGFSAGWRGAAVYAALGLLIYYCAAGLDRPPKGGMEPWKKEDGFS